MTRRDHAVLGPMEPGQLGVTLPHEHLLLDFTGATMGPGYGSSSGGCSADELAGLKLEIENLGKIRQFPYAGNLRCISKPTCYKIPFPFCLFFLQSVWPRIFMFDHFTI